MKYKDIIKGCIEFLQGIATDEEDLIIVNEYENTLLSYEKTNNVFHLYKDLCLLRNKYHYNIHSKYGNNPEYSDKFIAPIASLRLNLMRLS